jgi:C1A family cysteine protease
LFSNNTAVLKAHFDSFVTGFGRTYDSQEEKHSRFQIFSENLKLIDERNLAELNAGGHAKHGITRFSDLTQEEFKARYLTATPRAGHSVNVKVPALDKVESGVQVNWAGELTTPVKNQGYCGSCWAFSATEQIESDYILATGKTQVLAPQQITSCDKTSFGCNGGTTESAYRYVMSAGGLETESDYPYTSGSRGVTGSCESNSKDFVVDISGYQTVSSSSRGESDMASYVGATGPLSVCVDAESWSSYTSGVMKICGSSVDHCVQAVGLDTKASTPYWIVRNSWGVTWGEQGYIYLEYGQNTCAVASDATYTTGVKAV